MESKPIQLIPTGLLGFFQLKNGGQNPNVMPDTLQCVLEMRDWYLQTQAFVLPGTDVAIAAVGLANYLTVPNGKIWFVHAAQAQIQLAAAATYQGSLFYSSGVGGAAQFPFALTEKVAWNQATDGTQLAIGMIDYPRPLILNAGGIIGIRTYSLSAPTTTGNVVARITEIPI